MSGDLALLIDALEGASRAAITRLKRPVRIGLAGCQGSGKSQLAAAWAGRNPRVAQFSLDDVYLPTAARRDLAKAVSPLFKTRGVPGTHDLELAKRVFAQLAAARGARDQTPLPRYDKLADSPVPKPQWPTFQGAPNVILVEGWCLGALPQTAEALGAPVNALEAEEDAKGAWRAAVNAQLEGPYAAFFDRFDLIVFLAAPDWDVAPRWRLEQEAAARKATSVEALPPEVHANLARFMLHYERLTRHMLAGGRRSEITVRLDADRRVVDIDGL